MTKLYLIASLLFLLPISSCKKENQKYELPAGALTITKVLDVGNGQNGSDLWVEFTTSSQVSLGTDITEFRILISKVLLDAEKAFAKPASQYHALKNLTESNFKVNCPASLTDVDGNTLTLSGSYFVHVLAVGKEGSLQIASREVAMQNRPVYAGDYLGKWNDALFANFTVTMRVDEGYKGVIFYSSNFQPCCGGSQDGTISLTFNDKTISSFVVNQFLGSYKGGHCEATYTAKGSVTDPVTISITDIEGADCDGVHTPGVAIFTRIK